MNTKKSLALVSTSALAAGMAQGAVFYSGSLNLQATDTTGTYKPPVDVNGDGKTDFVFGYEGSAPKPYVDTRKDSNVAPNGIVTLLAQPDHGLPVTGYGTLIDANYALTFPPPSGGTYNDRAYMYEDGGNNVVGDWSNTAITDAYVGIELSLAGGTSYGWLHFIDNPVVGPSLTLVDYAYENTPGLGIQAGVVPEPSITALGALGLAGVLAVRRRR